MSALIFAAFLGFGFFAASLIPLAWVLIVAAAAGLLALAIALGEGRGVFGAFGLGAGGFALAQIGYALGLAWVARTRRDRVPD
ncbi:hypothetical protein P7D22_04285 [Lichenihabitans sp. Uapishka_5]|uniref:hypothetical protein n=1 Tax=Lichenihabitans sp. Uapishka_5 TaxID=3037302 RepID=UPI0029E7D4F9|nr:hypothetical protein [Lichenihabitans sp. Uapishka_5]MDX7950396.1 hypothetical protein [Lichenihabitans sp. Uapishka_5]